MPVYVLFGAFAVSVSIPILWWSLASDRRRSNVPTTMSNDGAHLTDAREIVLKEGAGTRVVFQR